MFITFHFQFSLKFTNKNKLCRFPKTVTKEFTWILIALLSGFFKKYAYPELFLFLTLVVILVAFIEAKHYCMAVEYIFPEMNRNLGLLSLVTIAFAIANVFYLLNVALFKRSLVVFIVFFFLFSAHFYLTYRSYHFKKIIIDDDTPY